MTEQELKEMIRKQVSESVQRRLAMYSASQLADILGGLPTVEEANTCLDFFISYELAKSFSSYKYEQTLRNLIETATRCLESVQEGKERKDNPEG